ncbi:MAG: DUF3078 domain-containing protein [Chitinispirillaceae bacterium]|nr:DUF3078 domain-containing protein [Chitinispirillaceae bacterium]
MSPVRLIAVLLFTAAIGSFADEPTPWEIDVDANVTLTQNAYTDSWIGSEKGAISWASRLNFVAGRQFTPIFNHRNTLKLAFGQTKAQLEDKSWGDFLKSTDLIDFESLQRFTMSGWVEPFLAVRLISQFVDGTDSTQDHYINPINLFESFGIARPLVTNDAAKWNARFGGAVNQLIMRYTRDETHDDYYTKVTNSAGLEFVTELKAKAKEGLLDFSSLLTVYEALVSSEKELTEGTAQADYWRYPDINWENILSVNITKYIMINLTAQLLYDRELHANARIKEVLALGLTYKFNNVKKAENEEGK